MQDGTLYKGRNESPNVESEYDSEGESEFYKSLFKRANETAPSTPDASAATHPKIAELEAHEGPDGRSSPVRIENTASQHDPTEFSTTHVSRDTNATVTTTATSPRSSFQTQSTAIHVTGLPSPNMSSRTRPLQVRKRSYSIATAEDHDDEEVVFVKTERVNAGAMKINPKPDPLRKVNKTKLSDLTLKKQRLKRRREMLELDEQIEDIEMEEQRLVK